MNFIKVFVEVDDNMPRGLKSGTYNYSTFADKTHYVSKIDIVREFTANVLTTGDMYIKCFSIHNEDLKGLNYWQKQKLASKYMEKHNIIVKHYGNRYSITIPQNLVQESRLRNGIDSELIVIRLKDLKKKVR